MTSEEYNNYIQSQAWKDKVNQRMEIDGGVCQMCGTRGNPKNPLECHHFGYRNLGNEDIWSELVIVCDCCHSMLTRLMKRKTSPDGRRGWSDSRTIPQVTVITYNGRTQEIRKENLET